ncbi:hypothetical protein TcWFU_008522 [Taenia crassiceps]|uniref:IgGFc-binding protein N-terminal domain-containing protein n=1 Tax=Taenia crassiceps TaxID=6207 RepID=A0ABR4Q6M9_9CEST
MLEKATFFIIAALYVDSYAQISSIKGDKRIIKGPVNGSFTLQSVLPDVYETVVVNNQSFSIANGSCTTSYFDCKYVQERPYHAVVTLKGKTLKELRWVKFVPKRQNVIPISIAVFVNNVWLNSTEDGLIPDPKQPFFVSALNRTKVSLPCTFSGNGTPAAVVVTKYSTLVYSVSRNGTVVNRTADVPEVVAFSVRKKNTSTTYVITVKRHFRIDYVGCTDGSNWITYMIEWVLAPPDRAPRQPVTWSVVMCGLFTVFTTKDWIVESGTRRHWSVRDEGTSVCAALVGIKARLLECVYTCLVFPHKSHILFNQTMLLKAVIFFLVVHTLPSILCYKTLPGDTRVVKGRQNEAFSYETSLPSEYVYLVSGIHNVTLANGDCSTPFFMCTYSQVNDTQTNVKMSGYMSYGLKWVTFMGGPNQVPVSIVFFTDDVWNDLAAGSIQPQYSVPLIVRAKGLRTVTLTCSIFATSPKFNLYTGVDNVLYYSVKPQQDETKKHNQILNLEIRNILMHKVVTLTVRKKLDIDFYSCNVDNYWLTHTIDWTQSGVVQVKATLVSLIVALVYAWM